MWGVEGGPCHRRGPGDRGAWLHCMLRAKEFVMHREVGGSGSVCNVGELGWRGRKEAVLGCEGISGEPYLPTPPFRVPTHPVTPGSQEEQPDSIANIIFRGSFICMEHALLIYLNTAPLSPPRSVQTEPAAVRKLQGVERCRCSARGEKQTLQSH